MVLYDLIRNLSNKKKKPIYSDFAPWITNLIIEFEKFENIELHIISPHIGLKKLTFSFRRNGIHYHFFKSSLFTAINKSLTIFFKFHQRYFLLNRILINRYIKKINPDLVNLFGTENPYYSISALDIKSIPVFISMQTVYTNPDRLQLTGSCIKANWDTELKIHRTKKYFGCTGRMHYDLLLKNNPEAIVFKMFFPIQKPESTIEVPKEYDFISFTGEISKKKGVEDAIEALALVKKAVPNVTLNIVGSCAPHYKTILIEKIKDLDLTDNVTITGYFPIHSDMYQHVKKGKYALLPVKLDVIPGSIIEAMLLGLPVVTYKTSGTPYLNKNGEIVLLAEIGDTNKLADNMLKLIRSKEMAEDFSKEAKRFAEKEFDNIITAKRFVNIYHSIIGHYYNNTPIPNELLFNVKEFPLY